MRTVCTVTDILCWKDNSVIQPHVAFGIQAWKPYRKKEIIYAYNMRYIDPRASKSPDFSGDLPTFDNIMKISRSPDLE